MNFELLGLAAGAGFPHVMGESISIIQGVLLPNSVVLYHFLGDVRHQVKVALLAI